ncbi:DNA-directed RNA polymerase I subunit rpa49 [Hanseniaspora osmophila]|uniref:DNA-directed RNA polymerase I subunit RPA49 n=1 Tax=Hanseniaspora osmophila TaxID=56408 RepID=A0A1E5RHC8_9ASCO|nr:DNA-directed RNA polymerase I subunit RPA49 [Hanseniaspora osmophila]
MVQNIKIKEIHEDSSSVVANLFGGINVPKDTKFSLYKKKRSASALDEETNELQTVEANYVVHGENERLEYKADSMASDNSQYLLGVYNPESEEIELYKTPYVADTVVISKAKKHLKGPKIKQAKDVRISTMRNALGEAFGTKKAKKAIADLERNRIDSEKLSENAIDIVDAVSANVSNLPTREQLDDNIDRPTPACNVDATDVEQIYPVSSIIPKREMQFIRCNEMITEEDTSSKLEYLPYQKSPYITKKIAHFSDATPMKKWQLLYYLSLLLGVYENKRSNNKEKLMENLNSPPEALIDGVLERFTILRAGVFGRSKERSFTIDPQSEDKLLCYILCCILHLDNFMVEISPLAQELNMKPSRLVNLFRALGCLVKGATVGQAEAFNIPKSAAATYKIASLKVPFKLPQMTRRGRRN